MPSVYSENVSGPVFFNSIIEDRQGCLWFGSNHGLYRNLKENYESVDPVLFFIQDSIIPVTILSLLEDSHRNFWIATQRHGLFEIPYDDNELKLLYKWDFNQLMHLDFDGAIHAIYEDRSGNIWLGTSKGLYKMIQSDGLLKCLNIDEVLLADNPVYGIAEDKNDNL